MEITRQQADIDLDAPRPADGTMRAVVQDVYGDADVLRLEQVAIPEPAAGEVLLRVRAAGLDRGAWHLMTGTPYAIRLVSGLRRPKEPVLGHEVAGTVVAVGTEVTAFAAGDEVFGIAKGSFAEYATARADKLARVPARLSAEQSAALPVSGLTALQALRDAGRVESGQHVLVTGASGGVGSYAVQLAKGFGAEVTAVCSAAKADFVRGLGADHVLDYATDDFADGTRRYDLIVDLAGNPSVSRLRRALTPTGTAVLAGGEQGGSWTGGMDRQLRGLAVSVFGRRKIKGLLCKERAEDLAILAGYVNAGTVTPVVDRTYPLDRVAEAMRHLEAGRARGKVVVTL